MSHETTNAGAEPVQNGEGEMSGAIMRGAAALPGSKATSRTKGSRRNLGGLASGRTIIDRAARVGKARNCSRR